MSLPPNANPPDDPNIADSGSTRCDGPNRVTLNGQAFVNALLSNQIMVAAYAVSIVVLAIGLVGLTFMIVYLCFFHPKEAHDFLILIGLGGPVAGVLLSQIGHRKQLLEDKEKLSR